VATADRLQFTTDLAPEGLYRFDRSVGPNVKTLDDVGENELAFYREYGYLVVEEAFTAEEVSNTIEAFLDLIDRGQEVQFERGKEELAEGLPREEKQLYIRKFGQFLRAVKDDPRLLHMVHHPKMLRVVELLLGGKPYMYTHQAFWKPPGGREKPWHQDKAYFNVSLDTAVVGVWIALDDATPENGCMHVIPGSHREGPVVHFKRRDWQICDTDVPVHRDVMVPLKSGGVLFFDGMIHHGTPPNMSGRLRRSLQFHFIPDGTAVTSDEDRMAIWGPEGKDVDC